MSEVKTYQVIGYLVKGKSLGRINVVSLSDYDALAAQLDKGLAREAQKNLVIDGLSLENQELQQHLAEAEKLLRKVDMRPADNTAEVPHGWWEKRAGLLLSLPTTTGCADGEKS